MNELIENKFNYTNEQYRLIYNAVRRYQFEKTVLNSSEYWNCSEILDNLFDLVYTQQREVAT
jgi:hypothetical protein